MLLSITMATYNVELYLFESLDSILNQTFKDFELICIDDGSTDGTRKILESYQKKDERIRVILKEKNEGLAAARNLSLKVAKGKYIVFLDGDDLFDSTLFSKAVTLAEKNNSDLVVWDYVTFYEKNEIKKLQKKESDLININRENKTDLLKRPSFTWIKLLRTEKARELGVFFPLGYTRQDIPVHWHLLTQIDNISIIPERLSFYRQHPTATTAKKNKVLLDQFYIMDQVEKYLHKNGLYELYFDTFMKQRLSLMVSTYDNIKHEYKLKALKLIKDRMTDDVYKYLNSKNDLNLHTRLFLLSINGSLVTKIKMKIWYLARSFYRKGKSCLKST